MTDSLSLAVRIGVFARAPVAGQAKTRLIPRVGEEGAARLQALLTSRAVGVALKARTGPVSLWCSPDCDHPLFAAVGGSGVSLHSQAGVDLGERMFHALDMLCRHAPAMLIGTDCAALTDASLREAAGVLRRGEDAVIVPAEDGGYVLIGFQRPVREIFDGVAWGTGRVMGQTRERLYRARMTLHELAPLFDVDRPSDFDRLLDSGLMPELADERWLHALDQARLRAASQRSLHVERDTR